MSVSTPTSEDQRHPLFVWLAARDARIKAEALAPIRAALAGHPQCDVHDDDDPVTCGWKRAVLDVHRALGEVQK